MSSPFSRLVVISQPTWSGLAGTAATWQRDPSIGEAVDSIGFGEGGFGEDGFGGPAINQSGVSQPVWTSWTTR